MTAILNLGYVLARRRLMSSFRIELTVLLGVTLAVVLLSSAVVFNDLLAETALRRALGEAESGDVNVWVRVFNDLDDPRTASAASDRYQNAQQFVAQRVLPPLGDAIGAVSFQAETATFYFAGRPNLDLPDDVRPRGRIQYLSGLRGDKGQLVEGRWPGIAAGGGYNDATGATDDVVIEVAVDRTGFEFLNVPLGEGFDIIPATGGDGQATTRVVIVGVIEPTNPDEEYWYRRDKLLSYHDDDWTLAPLFVSEEALRHQVGRRYPGIYTSSAWFLQVDRTGLPAKQVDEFQTALRQIRRDVSNNLPNGSTSTGLARILEDHEERLLLARIPLFLMVFLVTGILAYYLTITAGMVIRARAGEIAMLKSRGATTFQIGVLTLVEGLLLAVPAVVVGVLLSPLLAKALGGLVFDAASAGAPVSLSWPAFGMGAAGAALAVLVLSLATLAAAGKGIVEFRQSGARPARTPFVHRYYLDLLALVVIAFLWWQISNRGTVLTRSLGGRELEIDFALLLGPALGLIALGLLVMRFFPLAMGLSARIVGPVGPGWLVQGLRRIARDPIAPGSLVALLMLATALGVVGSAFSATLTRSLDDRIRYETGADIRIKHDGGRVARAYSGASQLLRDSAEVMRTEGSLLTEGFGSQRVSVLAVESDRLSDIAWWRDDFGDEKTLPELMALLAPNPDGPKGLSLPQDTTAISLWARTGGRVDDRFIVHVAARLRDDTGRYYDIPLGDVSGRDWVRLEGDIALRLGRSGRPTDDERRPRIDVPPHTLINIQVLSRSGGRGSVSPEGPRFGGKLLMEQLTAHTLERDVVVSELDSAESWSIVEDYVKPGYYELATSLEAARPGSEGAAEFVWSEGGIGLPGLHPGDTAPPLPAVVSPEILEATGAEVGERISLGMSTFALPILVTGVADFFPTVDPRQQPFVIADLGAFVDYSNLHSRRIIGGAGELWLDRSIPPGDLDGALAAAEEAVAQIDQHGLNPGSVIVAEEEANLRGQEPLANAGWGGLLVIMFLALALASASGIALFCWLDTRERRTEFALLRTLGGTRGQLNGVVWFNLAIVVIAGVAVGTWAGAQIGAALLPVLEVAEGGVRATPPLTFETDWRMLALAYAVLAVVSVVTVIWLAYVTGRLEVQRVLRAGEGG